MSRRHDYSLHELHAQELFARSLDKKHPQIWKRFLADQGFRKHGWLGVAVCCGNLEATESLIDSDADTKDYNNGSDLLGFALLRSYMPIAERLVANGADIWGAGNWKSSAFKVAVQQDNAFLLMWLLDQTSVVWHERYGRKPLFTAIAHGSANMVAWLLEHGADVEGRDQEARRYRTPLMHAVTFKKNHASEMVRLLLQAGANVFATDELGHTALDIANRSPGTEETVQILEDRMRK
jgi:ankyrin repeat protein